MSSKQIVSISLGSSSRDHQSKTTFLDQSFELYRRGTDGDFERAEALLQELDGKVDAIGLGGVDIYLYSRDQRYELRDGKLLREHLKTTPCVDGSGLKNTLERSTIKWLEEKEIFAFKEKKILMVCAMDRFGMAQALEETGGKVTYGDLIFSLGVNKPITSIQDLDDHARRLLPEICKLPISMIYPVGKKQTQIEPTELTDPYFKEADIIAGDFHYIRKNLPDTLEGKSVITNTVTQEDIKELSQRGLVHLVTTTPEIDGRSYGTNMLEAVMVTLLDKPWEECTPDDYHQLLQQLNWQPRHQILNEQKGASSHER